MVQMYTIAGRQIGSHHLAMLTLGLLGGGITLSMGGSKAKKADGPPINAQSPDEEKFIQDFLKQADGGDQKASTADAHKK